MWIQIGQTWANIFEFLEASSTSEADYSGISVAGVTVGPPETVSSLEVRIPAAITADLVI